MKLIGRKRTNRKGGGVSLFIKENFNFARRTELDIFEPDIESVFIELDKSDLSSQKNVLIGVIYRPPDRNLDRFLDYMNSILEI